MKRLTGCLLATIFLIMPPATSSAMDISTKGEIENLKRRIERLENGSKEGEEEKSVLALGDFSKYLSFWGVLEAEASYSKIE